MTIQSKRDPDPAIEGRKPFTYVQLEQSAEYLEVNRATARRIVHAAVTNDRRALHLAVQDALLLANRTPEPAEPA